METLWGPEIKASLLYFNMGMYTYILYSPLKAVSLNVFNLSRSSAYTIYHLVFFVNAYYLQWPL